MCQSSLWQLYEINHRLIDYHISSVSNLHLILGDLLLIVRLNVGPWPRASSPWPWVLSPC